MSSVLSNSLNTVQKKSRENCCIVTAGFLEIHFNKSATVSYISYIDIKVGLFMTIIAVSYISFLNFKNVTQLHNCVGNYSSLSPNSCDALLGFVEVCVNR